MDTQLATIEPTVDGRQIGTNQRLSDTILFVSGVPHLPQVYGGLEVNTHELALELNRRGQHAAVLAKLSPRNQFGWTRAVANLLHRRDVSHDTLLGYATYRSLAPWSRIAGLPLPGVAVIQNRHMVETARMFEDAGVPTIAYLHGLAFASGKDGWDRPASELPFRAYIANSRFTAHRFREIFDTDCTIIPPLMRPEAYVVQSSRKYVTFINPVPEKGVEVAFEMARLCPDIPFLFVKGWPLTSGQSADLHERACKLGNIEIRAPVDDMREIYGVTRILLVPSQWEAETWGRVASEAQYSAIPVLASNRGALPETVGPGGAIIAYDAPAEAWAAALEAMWRDTDRYRSLSDAAGQFAQRTDISVDHLISSFLSVVRSCDAE